MGKIIVSWGFEGGAYYTVETKTVSDFVKVFDHINTKPTVVAEDRVRQIATETFGELEQYVTPTSDSPWSKPEPVEDMSQWIDNDTGGKCPYDIGDLIDVIYRDGTRLMGIPVLQPSGHDRTAYSFRKTGSDSDIMYHRPHLAPAPEPETWFDNTGECPYERGTLIDVAYRDGKEVIGVPALQLAQVGKGRSATNWQLTGNVWDIVRHRRHVESN